MLRTLSLATLLMQNPPRTGPILPRASVTLNGTLAGHDSACALAASFGLVNADLRLLDGGAARFPQGMVIGSVVPASLPAMGVGTVERGLHGGWIGGDFAVTEILANDMNPTGLENALNGYFAPYQYNQSHRMAGLPCCTRGKPA